MFIVRQSRESDLAELLGIAKHLDSYNLPYNQEALREVLVLSGKSFLGAIPVEQRAFTFMLEECESGKVVGTSTLYAQHGTHTSPHVYLDVHKEEHYSETLKKYMVHEALSIGYNYNGPSEIGGLIIIPEYRGHPFKLGKLLSFARFVFIAMHRELFRDEILSELLPHLDEDGTSKLWKHLGKRFTGLNYREADLLSKNNKEFIRSLFPQGKIYTALFPESVRNEIGEVGAQTKGVEKMLRSIGFSYAEQIDPFDGGPHYSAPTDSIPLVKNSSQFTIASVEEPAPDGELHLLATRDPEFLCTWGKCSARAEFCIGSEVAKILKVAEGDSLWLAPV